MVCQSTQATEALAAFRSNRAGVGVGLRDRTMDWHLVRFAQSVTAHDASRGTGNQPRSRTGSRPMYPQRQISFDWHPEAVRCRVLPVLALHVPPEQFASFWELVRSCLIPGGRVFFIDGLYNSRRPPLLTTSPPGGGCYPQTPSQQRQLRVQIVKGVLSARRETWRL